MFRIIAALFLVILAATFSTLNREEITLRYFFGWSLGPFPLFILPLAALAVGLALGFSADWGRRRKIRREVRENQRWAEEIRREIAARRAEQAAPEPPAPSPEPPAVSPG